MTFNYEVRIKSIHYLGGSISWFRGRNVHPIGRGSHNECEFPYEKYVVFENFGS